MRRTWQNYVGIDFKQLSDWVKDTNRFCGFDLEVGPCVNGKAYWISGTTEDPEAKIRVVSCSITIGKEYRDIPSEFHEGIGPEIELEIYGNKGKRARASFQQNRIPFCDWED